MNRGSETEASVNVCNLSGTTTATRTHFALSGDRIAMKKRATATKVRDDSRSIVPSFEWRLDCRGSHAGSVEARVSWFAAGFAVI